MGSRGLSQAARYLESTKAWLGVAVAPGQRKALQGISEHVSEWSRPFCGLPRWVRVMVPAKAADCCKVILDKPSGVLLRAGRHRWRLL